MWHVPVPERRKTAASPSPPPPLPPVRSDSFAATTKVQERGLVIAYPESPAAVETHTSTAAVVFPKAPEKAPDRRAELPLSDNAKRGRNSHVPPAKGDAEQFYFPPDGYNPSQLGSNR